MPTISPITTTQQTNQAQAPQKTTKMSMFYMNDVHSNLKNLEKLKSASDDFDSFTPSEKTDKLKFTAGDIGVGRDTSFNRIAVDFQNSTNVMASAGGNHEFDLNKKDLSEVLKGAKYKFLGLNTEIPQTTDSNKALSKELIKSYIQEQNGNKYGVIGLMPYDFFLHLSDPDEYKDVNVLSIQKTVPKLQKEIDNLKEQGVDKVIVLSHCGYLPDVALAQAVEGIDVIVGGHTHDLIKGIQEGKNLFYSKKTGDPTIITQVGQNGEYFGVLNLEFDDKGVIKKAQNNVVSTNPYPRSIVMEYFIDKVLGKPEVIGTVKSAPNHVHTLISENPSVNFLSDIERKELDVDLAMINAGNIRANIEKGNLTDRDLKIITPFDNKLWVLKLSEKDLVHAVQVGASSLASPDHTPGFLQFSGLKYTVSKKGDVKSITFIDKNGNESSIDVKNPNPFKTYRVVVDDFIAKGGNKYLSGKQDNVEQKYDFDKNKVVIDYLKAHKEPIEIKTDSRITIVD